MSDNEREEAERWPSKAVDCRRCAGTGEYPPTGGGECSNCDGEGYVIVNDRGAVPFGEEERAQ